MLRAITQTSFRRQSLPVSFAALAIALMVLGFNYYLHFPLEDFAEERELEGLTTLFDGYTRQVEEQMIGVESTLAALGTIAVDERYSDREKHLLLKQAAEALDIVRVFGIMDVNGQLIHSSRTFPAPALDLSHRDYVQYFVNGGENPSFLSGPVKNVVDGHWQISMSRAIKTSTGELVGVISTVIDPGTMIDRIAKSANGVDYITLLDSNFNLIARQPAREDMIGKSMADAELFVDLVNSADGVVSDIYNNIFTGESRFGVAKRVFSNNLVVATSRPYDYAMQYWQAFSSGMTIASLLVMIFVVGTLWVINLRSVATQRYNEKLQSINSELEIAKSDAERLANIKEDFLANMSHEIRTPMNAIFGLTQLLQRTPLEKQQREYVRQLNLSGKFLLGVIDEILTFSKIEANELVVDHEPFVLSDVIDNVGSIMAMSIGEKSIETVIDVAPDIPRSVVGDAHRLQQILVNLISNAIKFTEEGFVHLKVCYKGDPDQPDAISFSVIDSGIGITKAQQRSIFDPFTQADASTTRKFGGTGLGLAISDRLAKAMGGSITMTSQPGKGSSFHLTLPLKAGPVDIAPELTLEAHQQNLRVLIVDDQEQTREALAHIAQSLYIDADTAPSGQAAIDILMNAQKPYDILMIDWRMPDLDGLETIERLSETEIKKMPSIIMVTAYQRELLEQAPKATSYEMLTKPVTGSAFFDAITKVTDARSAMRPGCAPAKIISPDALNGYHILVAEDNVINQQIAKQLLESLGAEVQIAENGVEAVAATEQTAFDIVLMDVQMPEMTGVEATQRIRASHNTKDLPIIALTAGVLENEQKKCREAGMNDFVGKPFDFELIVGKIVKHAPEPRAHTTITDTQMAQMAQTATSPQKDDWTQAPLRDDAQIPSLTAGNMDLYNRLCGLYGAQARDCQRLINDALKLRDGKTLGEQFHIMKGSSAQVAATKIAALSSVLEQSSMAGDFDTVDRLIGDFDQVLEQTLAVIADGK